MAKTRQQKEQELTALAEKYKKAKSAVFVQYFGLRVEDISTLRRTLKAEECELVVAKKSLLGLMLDHHGIPDAKETIDAMEGGVAVALGYADEVTPAKIIADFAKTHELPTFLGGVLEGRFLSTETVTMLSQVGTRQELFASIVGSLCAPLTGVVRVLHGPMQALVSVLQQKQQLHNQ